MDQASDVRTLALGETSGTVPLARDFTRSALHEWGWLPAATADRRAAAEDVLLVVSELVTNACLHAEGPERLLATPRGEARSAQLAPASRAVSIRPVSHPASRSRTCRSSISEARACSGAGPAPRASGVSCWASRRAWSMAFRAAAAARNDAGLWASASVETGWSGAVTAPPSGVIVRTTSCLSSIG